MSPPRKPSGPRVAKARLASRHAAAPLRRLRGAVPHRLTPVNPDALGEPSGFTHGWVAPANARLLFVAGQTAADARGRIRDAGFAAQFDAALARALVVVQAAGGRPEHVVRMTVFVTDLDAYRRERKAIGEAWKARMGSHFPAIALLEVSRLVDEGATVEIEVTAALPASPQEMRE
jgi:enamine deaminase RidA (YjgF/YER057c/UK114 family)